MEKQILVPVSDSRRSLRAVRYAAHATRFINDLHFVIFNVQPMISLYLQEEAVKDLHVRAELNKIKAKNQQSAMTLLESYKAEMISLGVDEECITLKTEVRKLGLAQDIIEYAQENLYDAILVGRQRISGIQKMFSSCVASAVLEGSQVLPVWMVDGTPSATNILIAVDGSESAMRAVDHAGFMVSKNPDVNVTLLHVTNSAQNYCTIDLDDSPEPEFVKIVEKGNQACIDQFYPLAIKKLRQMGLGEDQVRFESVQGGRRLGKTVVEYADKHNFDTLVIGRTGIDKAFLMGSCSRQIINGVSEGALWVVN
ncbi:MAG: universal stress protein [Desulfobacterales bacterium]|nr:universal stress protein [Desulfobacterales bacterium]